MIADGTRDNPVQGLIPLLIDLQSNLDRANGLADLARQFGCSPFHFHRYFSNAVGETPKQHVDRLRLERAAYALTISEDAVLDIALSVGFKTHETFSRAFRRAFDCTPKDYRKACRTAQAARLESNRGFRGEGCSLSDVQFVNLPAMTCLAIRRHGAYMDFRATPFLKGDDFWNDLVDWANRHKIAFQPLAFVISYDDPTVTPKDLQRLDLCIPVAGDFAACGRIRRLEFAGGRYGAIEHAGPLLTIDQAYRNLADGIRRSRRYEFDKGPPVQIFRKFHIGGDPDANITEVYFPVRPVA